MASATGAFKGRDEFRKAQELEEARKAGLAPAAVDEDGKEINPHIPQYMAAAPWYLNNDKPVRACALRQRRRRVCVARACEGRGREEGVAAGVREAREGGSQQRTHGGVCERGARARAAARGGVTPCRNACGVASLHARAALAAATRLPAQPRARAHARNARR
jgi:hypothetical protein